MHFQHCGYAFPSTIQFSHVSLDSWTQLDILDSHLSSLFNYIVYPCLASHHFSHTRVLLLNCIMKASIYNQRREEHCNIGFSYSLSRSDTNCPARCISNPLCTYIFCLDFV